MDAFEVDGLNAPKGLDGHPAPTPNPTAAGSDLDSPDATGQDEANKVANIEANDIHPTIEDLCATSHLRREGRAAPDLFSQPFDDDDGLGEIEIDLDLGYLNEAKANSRSRTLTIQDLIGDKPATQKTLTIQDLIGDKPTQKKLTIQDLIGDQPTQKKLTIQDLIGDQPATQKNGKKDLWSEARGPSRQTIQTARRSRPHRSKRQLSHDDFERPKKVRVGEVAREPKNEMGAGSRLADLHGVIGAAERETDSLCECLSLLPSLSTFPSLTYLEVHQRSVAAIRSPLPPPEADIYPANESCSFSSLSFSSSSLPPPSASIDRTSNNTKGWSNLYPTTSISIDNYHRTAKTRKPKVSLSARSH